MPFLPKYVHISKINDIELKKWRHSESIGLKNYEYNKTLHSPPFGREDPMPLEPLGILMVEPRYKLPSYKPDYEIPYSGHYELAANAVLGTARRFHVDIASTFYNAKRGPLIFVWSQLTLVTAAFQHMDQAYAEAFNNRSWWKSLLDGTYPTRSEMHSAFEHLESIFQDKAT